MSKQREVEKTCPTCKHNKYKDFGSGFREWGCDNENSDCFTMATAWDDVCEDWEEKEK